MSGWKAVGIPLLCGLITIGIGAINVWLGVLALPVMYSFAKALLSR
jgi:hypothetical protein